MTLGPARLSDGQNLNRMILRRKENRPLFRLFFAEKITWGHSSLSDLKRRLRMNLRAEQEGRCIYCRRLILIERRNVYEDIEHFLDKSKAQYRRWAFTYLNLALACHACNVEKNTRDLGAQGSLTSSSYLAGAGIYRWLHPYFDDYHANVIIGKGWTYTVPQGAPAAAQAARLIAECKLSEIETIEAYGEAIKKRILRLTVLAGKATTRQRYALASRLIAESIRYQEEQWPNH
ncbi:hypothetical protein [Burkholderia cepacia]|uniref:hypothetical protein n=1 Tax=Burkholderia TaxID=32008 RepID=UPI002AB7B990|nr:hypothetical protein [Burkholderia cepacia]